MTLWELSLDLARAFTLLLPILIPGLFFIACIKRGWLLALNKPIDFGLSLGKTRLFGPTKNWRGLVIYVVGGTGIAALLHLLQPSQAWIAPVYAFNPWILGPVCCLAYVLGELVNSFIKRRLGIAPSQVSSSKLGAYVQAFFDNADGAIGFGIALNLLARPTGNYLLLALVLAFLVHALSDLLMRKLSIKKKQN